jgi:hypothetical protein
MAAHLQKQAEAHLPDVFLDAQDAAFLAQETTVGGDLAKRVILRAAGRDMVFSVWARAQLLTTVGTREKWFDPVDIDRQVDELNQRLPSLRKQVARIRTIQDADACMLRGIVSRSYAHLPDAQLFDELCEACPEMQLLRGRSVLTETSLYCFVTNPVPLQIPGTQTKILGGALVRNSEVGYTSLWVSPFHAWVYEDAQTGKVTRRSIQVSVSEKGSFRRAHRGHAPELRQELATALRNTPLYDAPRAALESTLGQLHQIQFSSEKEALERADAVLRRSKASGAMRKLFETAYKGSPRSVHTGLSVYETVLKVAADPLRDDDAYAAFAVAGAVLLHLTA